MSDLTSASLNQDEKVMAALSHITILVPMIGVVAPVIIWATQKDKSRYVAFQSLQAVAYQITLVLAWFIGMGCYMFSIIAAIIPLSVYSGSSQQPGAFEGLAAFIPFLIFGVFFIGGFLFIVYGSIGAVMAFQGKPFRYILIGKAVERFMESKQDEPAA